MYSDWSVEMEGASPVLFVPWTDESGRLSYIDLRSNPEGIGGIPEAVEHPALGRALLALNGAGSNIATAKCDVWPLDASDLAACADLLDLDDPAEDAAYGFGSYIDTVVRDPEAFASLELHLELLRNLAKGTASLEVEDATAEFVLRRCMVASGETTSAGHAVTVYVYGVGSAEKLAYARWSEALAAVVELLLEL